MTAPPGWAKWCGADDERLLALCREPPVGNDAWCALAKIFPGRSAFACRQRYFTLRRLARGEASPARIIARKPPDGSSSAPAVDIEASLRAASQLRHASLTAAILGDPLPGRSALDRRAQA